MGTAHISARIHAANWLTEAARLVQGSRPLICFERPLHAARFDRILGDLETLINEAMKAGGE